MAKEYPLRFYVNTWKVVFIALFGGTFLALSLWLRLFHRTNAHQTDFWYTLAGIVGVGVWTNFLVVYLTQFLMSSVLRYPLLEIDAYEWRSWHSPFVRPQNVAWPDIAAVAVYHQRGFGIYYLFI